MPSRKRGFCLKRASSTRPQRSFQACMKRPTKTKQMSLRDEKQLFEDTDTSAFASAAAAVEEDGESKYQRGLPSLRYPAQLAEAIRTVKNMLPFLMKFVSAKLKF